MTANYERAIKIINHLLETLKTVDSNKSFAEWKRDALELLGDRLKERTQIYHNIERIPHTVASAFGPIPNQEKPFYIEWSKSAQNCLEQEIKTMEQFD